MHCEWLCAKKYEIFKGYLYHSAIDNHGGNMVKSSEDIH